MVETIVLAPGDEGLLIARDGRINILLPGGTKVLTPRHEAAVGAVLQTLVDPVLAENCAAFFRLYTVSASGRA